uniref:Uncharacterized protein n=1 Tax=Ascaris lumbricoides TaxID=6252 RepID=A0A0M3IIT3_ASCLU
MLSTCANTPGGLSSLPHFASGVNQCCIMRVTIQFRLRRVISSTIHKIFIENSGYLNITKQKFRPFASVSSSCMLSDFAFHLQETTIRMRMWVLWMLWKYSNANDKCSRESVPLFVLRLNDMHDDLLRNFSLI